MLRRQALLTPFAFATSNEIAETTAGRVRGMTGNSVTVFRAIPYAKQSRFLPPNKLDGWTGERDCTRTGLRCVQGPGNIFLSPNHRYNASKTKDPLVSFADLGLSE